MLAKGLMEIERMDNGVDKILMVAGARPNFMKIAPIVRRLRGWGIE